MRASLALSCCAILAACAVPPAAQDASGPTTSQDAPALSAAAAPAGPQAPSVQGTYAIATGKGGTRLAVSQDGRLIFVADHAANTVSVIDARRRRAVATIRGGGEMDRSADGGGRGVWDVAPSSNGRLIYVSAMRDRLVSIVDLSTRRMIGQIRVGTLPSDMLLNRNDRRLYVIDAAENALRVVDTARRHVIGSPVPLGASVTAPGAAPQPAATRVRSAGLGLSPDGRRLYATDRAGGALVVIDPDKRAVLARVPVGPNPVSIVVARDTGAVYVLDDAGVVAVDTNAEPANVRRVLQCPAGALNALADGRDGRYLLAVASQSNRVFVIDRHSGRIGGQAATGARPRDARASGGTVYTVDGDAASVSAIPGPPDATRAWPAADDALGCRPA
ncbi:YncE family protein [Chitinasiproducens palmae]|uniref:40-residue YVTN family beta-propeller repeat-containing protein n=1 Tax=Chitinasiproducens palmae TaxID=1770053 RepID=A0A1H2PK55_9BURK|nr:beta-propeller fold lactonase family protein [Chitinasiproducens palmae]SDV46674.1 40-residue YVTN family beta-propeller repeat-containing protein [Chitinasiproducens palmae]